MEKTELAVLCKAVSVFQGTTFDADTIDGWWRLLRDLHGPTALTAVDDLAKTSTDYITPARIRARYFVIIADRIRRAGEPRVPYGLDSAQYSAWYAAYRDEVSIGVPVQQAEDHAYAKVGLPAPVRAERVIAAPDFSTRQIPGAAIEGEIIP